MFGNLDFMYAEVIGLLGSALLLGGYHLYLRVQLRRNPNYRIQAVNECARAAWVDNIMMGPANEMLAVQTLRNSTMAAVFLATTAILMIMGVVHLGSSALLGMMQHFDLATPESDTIWVVRLLPLLLDLFWAFFCFSLAIRSNHHVGYLINTGNKTFRPTPAYVTRVLNRGADYFTLGMRAYYFTVPLIFGLFNPLFMVMATLALIVVLFLIDRAPDGGGSRFCPVSTGAKAIGSGLRKFKGEKS